MFSKINATVLIVKDLEAARAFYVDTLGLGIAFEDEVSTGYKMDGHDFLILQESAAIEMISAEAISLEGGHRVLLCAEVADVDERRRRRSTPGARLLHVDVDPQRACPGSRPADELRTEDGPVPDYRRAADVAGFRRVAGAMVAAGLS